MKNYSINFSVLLNLVSKFVFKIQEVDIYIKLKIPFGKIQLFHNESYLKIDGYGSEERKIKSGQFNCKSLIFSVGYLLWFEKIFSYPANLIISLIKVSEAAAIKGSFHIR